jgi:hypothetical protein
MFLKRQPLQAEYFEAADRPMKEMLEAIQH